MGENQKQPFQMSFNRFLRVAFQGSRVTSNGGLILVRELDERLGFGKLVEQHLTDPRANNARLSFADLLRQSVYSRLAGYEDVNDAEQLSRDPTFRLIGSEKIWDRGAALPSRLQTFETELLAEEGNFAGLVRVNRELIGKAEGIDSPHRTVLDMDSTEIPVYGQQEQSAYNGHFESSCYHPLLLFNREGDCLAAKLRPGNVHSAEDWEELLLPEIERQQKLGKEVVFRADAAFAKPEIYEALEEREVKYAIRIPANDSLQRDIEELLTRPVGRPSKKPLVEFKGFLYQAASWKTARRVVAKVEHHPGELFPRVGFIVTNLTLPSRAVVRFYNKRGTAEQWIKEGKQVKATIREAMATTEDLADQLTAFFGYFYGYLGILSLGIQLLLTRRILERLGVLAALIMLPACYLLGSGVLFLLPGIAAATGMKGAGLLLKHSVARSSLELLYLPLSGQMKYATKSFIDTAVWRMSDGVGGIILLLFATILEWSPRMLVWVNLPLILGWIFVSFMARKDYVGTLRASIRRRILNPEHVWVEWHEPETVQELRTSLKREKETELLPTLKIVEWAELKELSEPLQELTRHSSPRVRARALALLTSWEVPQAVRDAEALLTDEDLDVRTAAAHTISLLGRGPPQEKLRELLDHPVPGIRSAAVICLLQEPDGGEVETCRRVLEEIVNLSGAENAPARRDVARTLGHRAAHKIGERLLPRLFEDLDMQVRRTAIQSAAHYTNPDWIPLFIVQLGIRRARGAVLDTLAAYGPAVIPTLSPWLTEPAWPGEVRKRVAKLFGRLNSPEAFPPLIRALEDPQPDVRYVVLKSMARLHRSCPECPLPRPLLLSVLRREAEGAYLYLGGLQCVLSSPGSFADPVFLRWALRDRYEKALARIFHLLGLIHPTKPLHQAFTMLRASQPIPRANAVEYLDQTLTGPTKALIMPLVTPELDMDARLQHGQRNFPPLSETYRKPWPELLRVPDTLLRICLLTSLGPQSDTIPTDRIAALEREDNPLVRTAAQHALAQAGESAKV